MDVQDGSEPEETPDQGACSAARMGLRASEQEAVTVIEITPGLGISEHELTFTCDRSPGPGGQNVNKSHTRVTLLFDVASSVSLSHQQKKRVCEALGSRISRDGVLRIVSCKERTQLANRRAAVNRFIELINQAFHTPKPRKATKPTAGSQQRRLDEKGERSSVKSLRSARVTSDE